RAVAEHRACARHQDDLSDPGDSGPRHHVDGRVCRYGGEPAGGVQRPSLVACAGSPWGGTGWLNGWLNGRLNGWLNGAVAVAAKFIDRTIFQVHRWRLPRV